MRQRIGLCGILRKKLWQFQTGLALGVDFFVKNEVIMEMIASRKNENDNRFRALARSLVFKFKPIVSWAIQVSLLLFWLGFLF